MSMNEHESVQRLLALSAAGVLDTQEQLRVNRHTHECDICRGELETWSTYAHALHQLPQPAVPVQLLQRTEARFLREQAAVAGRRHDERILIALALFAWIVSLADWLLLRGLMGGVLLVMDMNVLDLPIWSLASTVLVWASAGAAAIVLAKRQRELRRVL